MFDLDAPIIPGVSAGGVSIGDAAREIVERAGGTFTASCVKYPFGAVTLWVRGGRVTQVGVGDGYRGKIAGTPIGVGSLVSELEEAIGYATQDEFDDLIVPRMPGFCFETAYRGKTVTEIFVYSITDN